MDSRVIPLRDENPTRRFAWVTMAIIALNSAAFAYELSLPTKALQSFIATWALTPASLVGNPADPRIWLTVIVSMFLHGGWIHLGGNMLYLWIFGNNIEDRLGGVRFIGFYLASGLAAALGQVVAAPTSAVPLIGASGAIAGVLGAYLVMYPRARVLTLIPIFFIFELISVPAVFVIGVWFLMQVAQGVGSISNQANAGGVAWWAHVGGFLAGAALIAPAALADRRTARFRTWR